MFLSLFTSNWLRVNRLGVFLFSSLTLWLWWLVLYSDERVQSLSLAKCVFLNPSFFGLFCYFFSFLPSLFALKSFTERRYKPFQISFFTVDHFRMIIVHFWNCGADRWLSFFHDNLHYLEVNNCFLLKVKLLDICFWRKLVWF